VSRVVGVVSPGVSESVSTTVVVLVLAVSGRGDPVKMVAKSSMVMDENDDNWVKVWFYQILAQCKEIDTCLISSDIEIVA
jgi:hypothetical protein